MFQCRTLSSIERRQTFVKYTDWVSVVTSCFAQRSEFNSGYRIALYKNDYASELRSCVKVDVTVMGSLSLISLMDSVDVKQH